MILLLAVGGLPCRSAERQATERAYPVVGASFELPEVRERFFETEVWGELTPPSGTVRLLPAFFDGTNAAGTGVWRLRITPREPGPHRLTVWTGDPQHRRQPVVAGFTNGEFVVTGEPLAHGFVRIAPGNPRAFACDDGTPYYPIGLNTAWEKSRATKMAVLFEKMHAAGLNWGRVWMTHFYKSSNLDWVWGKPIPPGTLDLEVARLWDQRIQAAERNDIRLQVVLQHHGQYNSLIMSDWRRNPWNVQNGGFLATPEAFFTDPRARELTRMKWRYAVARWGYSTSIMAWELFNEVELTDAYTSQVAQAVADWHGDMAAYLRSIDPYGHLITSSAPPLDSPLWQPLDYYQPHAYPQDTITAAMALAGPAASLAKPVFYGEMGRAGDGLDVDDGRDLRRILWPGLLTCESGAPQYWSWTAVDTNNLWPCFRAATALGALTGLTGPCARHRINATVATDALADIRFGGSGWMATPAAEIDVPTDGSLIQPPSAFSAYIHGAPDKLADGYPGSVTLRLDARQPTTVSADIAEISHFGAGLTVSVDDTVAASNAWPTTRQQELRRKPVAVSTTLTVRIPAGRHRVRFSGTGPDWLLVSQFTVRDYVPALRAVAHGTPTQAVAWIVNQTGIEYPPLPHPKTHEVPLAGPQPPPATGTLSLPGLEPGPYRVMWWDTLAGRPLDTTVVRHGGGTLRLTTPPIAKDIAVWVRRQEGTTGAGALRH